ncbi:hypothetical protein XELAEV_18038660mg [Xenopus laevis]|uniref:Uncharacterized protein n=1 Tax=Xenopus laevis TaxID=8355 RepID=A0A974C7L9_XENLA|nr:hypothetical protein XELAEV_18038660mg [Xenopus laevis]
MRSFSKEESGQKGLRKPLSDILDTRETSVVPEESPVPQKKIPKEESTRKGCKRPLSDILDNQPDENKRFKPDRAVINKTPIMIDGIGNYKMMPKTSEAERLLPDAQKKEEGEENGDEPKKKKFRNVSQHQ